MASRAAARRPDVVGLGVGRVGDMALVVRAVGVLAVPARREGDDGPDAADAGGLGQRRPVGRAAVDVAVVALVGHAAVAHLSGGPRLLEAGVADEHAEAGLEGRDLGFLLVGGDVIHGDAAVAPQPLFLVLGHALEAAVAGAEEEHGGPVVGEVLAEGAARARRLGREVVRGRVHGRVEGVAADDLVQMRRGDRPRVDEGVDAVDHQLRAAESHHGEASRGRRRPGRLARDMVGQQGQRDRLPLHFEGETNRVVVVQQGGERSKGTDVELLFSQVVGSQDGNK